MLEIILLIVCLFSSYADFIVNTRLSSPIINRIYKHGKYNTEDDKRR
jgi:hypothetical protein